jgi:hypothetical protein
MSDLDIIADVIEKILFYIPIEDVINFCSTNKKYSTEICQNSRFWHRKSRYKYGVDINTILTIPNIKKYEYLENVSDHILVHKPKVNCGIDYYVWYCQNFECIYHSKEAILSYSFINKCSIKEAFVDIISIVTTPYNLEELYDLPQNDFNDMLLTYGTHKWFNKDRNKLPLQVLEYRTVKSLYSYFAKNKMWYTIYHIDIAFYHRFSSYILEHISHIIQSSSEDYTHNIEFIVFLWNVKEIHENNFIRSLVKIFTLKQVKFIASQFDININQIREILVDLEQNEIFDRNLWDFYL